MLIHRLAARSTLYLLLAALHATLYLVLPDVTALLIPWTLFLVLSFAGLFLGGSVERKLLFGISYLLLLAGLLFVVDNLRKMNRAEAEWDRIYPEVIGELREAVNRKTSEHIEGSLQLLSRIKADIFSIRAEGSEPEVLRRHLFRILEKHRTGSSDFGDLVMIVSDFDGEVLAWSGDIYMTEGAGPAADRSSDSPSVGLLRENIFTAAVMTDIVPGLGILSIYDYLDLERRLSSRYSEGGRFIDRLYGQLGLELSLYPADYPGSLEGKGKLPPFALVFRDMHIGNWVMESITREGYISSLETQVNRFLPAILLVPWLLSFLIIREWLAGIFLVPGRSPVRGQIPYVLLYGAFLFLLRLVLLEASFPISWSSWIGADYFSSRFLGTGLLDEGSRSVGELVVSGLFISLFLLHVYPLLTGWSGAVSREEKRRYAWTVGGLALATFLSFDSPFVLERLLRDSLPSMIIEQDFLQLGVPAVWELGIFLLALPLFLLVAVSLRPLISSMNRGKNTPWMIAIAGALFFVLEILTAQSENGVGGFTYFGLTGYGFSAGCFVLAGGGVIALITNSGGSEPKRLDRWINLRTIVILSLLSAALIYPGLLRYRHLTLERTGRELVDGIGTPYDNRADFWLEKAARDLLDREEELFPDPREPLWSAYRTWVNLNLDKTGLRPTLALFDGEGTIVSRFSLADFEIDERLAGNFREEALTTDTYSIFPDTSTGKELYTVVVPFRSGEEMAGFLSITLPMEIEDRLEEGPIRFFMDDSGNERLVLPKPMEISIKPFDGELPSGESGWEWGRGDRSGVRVYRGKVDTGESPRLVEVAFPIQGFRESMARVNFLFILHFCLMILLWAIVTGGFRNRPWRGGSLFGTFHKRLQVALIVFSIVPTLLLGVGGTREIRNRIDRETRSNARDGLEAFENLVERDLSILGEEETDGATGFYASEEGIFYGSGSPHTGDGKRLRLDSRYVRELARAIGRDILIYRDNELVESSQQDLIQAGMIPRFLEGNSYVEMVLGGKDFFHHGQSLGNFQYLVGNLRVTPDGADDPVILSTPMLWRKEEVDQEVARLYYFLLVIMIGILFVASGVGVVVSSNLTRPINYLKDAFARVGSGDFRIDLEKGSGEEFDQLFVSFEQMSRQLETSQSRLSEEKARLNGILQSVGAGIMAFGNDGRLRIANARANLLLGVNLIEQVGKDLEAIRFANPEWLELTRGVRGVMTSEKRGFEREFSVTSGEVTKTIRMNANRLTSESGENQGAVIAFEDITDTIRSQKIVAWGEMARQVAHEIKNPLTPIRLSIQHLHKTFRDGAPDFPSILDDEVRVILREIDRLRNIAGDFSRFSKPETEEVRSIDVAAVINEIRELYEKEQGEITYSFETGAGEIRGMASEEGLKRVLVNLIENGREAVGEGGDLRVEVEEEQESNRIRIIVTDTGRGIPKSDLGKIFDPSFSTRSGGTGLGLAICKRIVDGWGGEIEISSREGEGTRVEVRIRARSG